MGRLIDRRGATAWAAAASWKSVFHGLVESIAHSPGGQSSHQEVGERFVTVRTATASVFLAACLVPGSARTDERTLAVTATAYNSVPEQTNEEPWIAAWGDSLSNGMRIIAVSRDLLTIGLERGTVVQIDGLPGEYVVLDKMNKRWRRKIDVYMGDDIRAARHFGRRDVTIRWHEPGAVASAPPDIDSVIAEAETP